MELSTAEQLAYSTVRIECILNNGHISSGTGFFYRFKDDKEKGTYLPAIITNKHVVKNAVKVKILLSKADPNGNPLDKEHIQYEMNGQNILIQNHPDADVDLCAIPIGHIIQLYQQAGINVFYRTLNNELIPNSDTIKTIDAYEDILMIGYPNGLWDSVNNKPLFRKGVTASHPKFDYCGKKEIMIDAACFPGSSGSPVFIYNEGVYKEKGGDASLGTRIILLGVLYSGPQHTVQGQIINVPIVNIPMSIATIPNNLGYIIKSERILELEKTFDNVIVT